MTGQGSTRTRFVRIGLGMIALGLVATAAWSGGERRVLSASSAARTGEASCLPVNAPLGVEVGPRVGQRAPDFTLANFAGTRVSLSSFRGCPVLLDFWASWCKPCEVWVPHLESLRQKYAPRGLKVVAVSLDWRREDAVQFVETKGMRGFINLWAPFAETRAIAQLFGVEAIPRTVLLDRQGIIRFSGHPQHLTDEVVAPWL